MDVKFSTREWTIDVPLDHEDPAGKSIEVFAREIWAAGNKSKDIFVFLQGGPGFPAPRDPRTTPWLAPLLKDFRVLLVDQRGTGRSSPIGPDTANAHPDARDLAKYLSFFRADSTVRDLEIFRQRILKNKRWFLLGQSYGGFMSFTYLSLFPEALKGVITTGGCPPLSAPSLPHIYHRLLDGIRKRNQVFYRKYPGDRQLVKQIVDHLIEAPILLPDGGILTASRFLDIGPRFLGTTGGLESLHYFLDQAFRDSQRTALSYSFIHSVMQATSYETNPIYAVLHEAIYCELNASTWAADSLLSQRPEFASDAESPLFLGETIRQAMFDEYALLRPFREAALILATKSNWSQLYDRERLRDNNVPVECIIYKTDFYVDFAYSLDSVAATRNAHAHVHDSWQHDAIRTQSKELMRMVLPKLLRRVKAKVKAGTKGAGS